jgi:UDP-N-acetylmuramate--alanine ligase
MLFSASAGKSVLKGRFVSMMKNPHPICDYLVPGKRVHLVGIGGVSMCPLAEVLRGQGLTVQGSDMSDSDTVKHLRSLGITVSIGHNAENLGDCDFVVRTAAVHDSNPEIAGAVARGIPVYERAQAWGAIMQRYPNALCVSGTHGKTTTTSMCAHIFMAAQADPTVMLGGTLPLLHAGYRVGQGDTIILESCEYCNSFLSFFPTVAVILNVEEDHLDFFKDLQDIQHSFRSFAELVPAAGHVIVNADNAGAMDSVADLSRPVFTFGLDHAADCTAADLQDVDGAPSFDILMRGQLYAHVTLQVYGRHNVLNALAAASAAYVLGIPGSAVEEGLATFTGAGRRFEHKGVFHGAEVYDDYAHHPDELHALLTTARTLGYQRVVVAFQPHTYTRTARFFDRFVEELKLADVVVLAEIYAAREQNDLGISSADLCRQLPGSVYCSTLDKVAEQLRSIARPGDLILTVGAGDIYRAGETLLQEV